MKKYDVAIIGGGITGIAIAYITAIRGLRVALFERHGKLIGASVRTAGLIRPIAFAGKALDRALNSREIWLDLAEKAGFWIYPGGSVYPAYSPEEWDVINGFYENSRGLGYDCAVLDKSATIEISPAVNANGLIGALYSRTEINIDPRQAILKLHQYLQKDVGVDIFYNTPISDIAYPFLGDQHRTWQAEQIYICNGDDFQTLYPDFFRRSNLSKCKTQMMRTVSQKHWKLGPAICSGLHLLHDKAFQTVSSLKALKRSCLEHMPQYLEFDIRVSLGQSATGEIVIGASHVFCKTPDPFIEVSVNTLIQQIFNKIAVIPNPEIRAYWYGIHVVNSGKPALVASPEKHVFIVNGLGPEALTSAFGLARDLIFPTDPVREFSL